MPSDNLADDLTRTPIGHATITLPADLDGGDQIELGPLAPLVGSQCRAVQWCGEGEGILWYKPSTPRQAFTTTEAAAPVPNARDAVPLRFSSTWEEKLVQAVAIDSDSTDGLWVVTF